MGTPPGWPRWRRLAGTLALQKKGAHVSRTTWSLAEVANDTISPNRTRVLEYGKNCRFLRRLHSQPQPVQTLRASPGRRSALPWAAVRCPRGAEAENRGFKPPPPNH